MIVGVGVDLVEIDRIAAAWQRFGDRFARKILAPVEMARFESAADPVHFLAKRFAAKEAAAKALGTGMRAGVHFSQIIVSHRSSGAPTVGMEGAAAERAGKIGASAYHISLSDERGHALAFVVLEG